MNAKKDVRELAHELVDRMPTDRLQALLDLVDEDFFSEKEMAEIQELRASEEWSGWRDPVMSDVVVIESAPIAATIRE